MKKEVLNEEIKKEDIFRCIESYTDELINLSDTVWEAAELAFNESKSADAICRALDRYGFEVETDLANIETAFLGKFGSGKPVIGFLGEFDALSNLSQEACSAYKNPLEEDGNGHGCGHNLLGVGSLAAAIGLKEYLEKTGKEGTVIYFGCPGEEGGSGKAFMARDGVFDQVDAVLTWHPGDSNSVSSGSSLANIQAVYRFYGVSAHAASSPHMGRSALDGVELMDVGANYLREHIISDARIHYAVTNTGGKSPGVVQPYAEVVYLIRAPKIDQVQEIYERINEIARGAAMMTGTRVEVDFIKACSDTLPNTTLEEVVYENMKKIPVCKYDDEEMEFAKKIYETIDGNEDQDLIETAKKLSREEGEKILQHKKKPLYDFLMPYIHSEAAYIGSTDVGDVSQVCPTVQIGAASWVAGTAYHSWQATSQGKSSIAYKSMIYVGKVLSSAAIDLVEKPELLENAKKEHLERTGGIFVSPIPKDVKPRKSW